MRNLDPPDTLLEIKAAKVKLVVILVGLPATGKSYLSHKLHGYLEWIGFAIKMFNVGAYRREEIGAQGAQFFDFNDSKGIKVRDKVALDAVADMVTFLRKGGQIAIIDGANVTRRKRQLIRNYMKQSGLKFQVIWLESLCTEETLGENIRRFKVHSLDYKAMTQDAAVKDIRKRIQHFQCVYESIHEKEFEKDKAFKEGYIQLAKNGNEVKAYGINGYLPGRIMYFLVNLRQNHNPIWLSRHGQSQYNVKKLLGGDPSLSPLGREYAKKLATFIGEEPELAGQLNSMSIWCSTLKRTIETANNVTRLNPSLAPPVRWKSLDEINAGRFDGYTYERVKKESPIDYQLRKSDKLRYRYPQGESYLDVVDRLESVIFELEHARKPVLVIGHQAVLRCLYAYFLDLPMETTPHLQVPLHTLIKLTPTPYGCDEERFNLLDIPGENSTDGKKTGKHVISYKRRNSMDERTQSKL